MRLFDRSEVFFKVTLIPSFSPGRRREEVELKVFMNLSEFKLKLQRLRGFLRVRKLQGVLLSTRANYSWLTCGRANKIRSDIEKGVASLWVTQRSVELWCNNIEENRFRVEEAKGLPFEYRVHPWYEKFSPPRHQGAKKEFGFNTASDDGAFGTLNLKDEIAELRWSLTQEEAARYRKVGLLSGQAMEIVGHKLKRGWQEEQVAAELSRELVLRGLEPSVVLVAADERLRRFRHPLPTANKIKQTVMMVICAKGQGLIANLTRLIHFGPLSLDLKLRHRACLSVECALWAASRPGVEAGLAFRAGAGEYSLQGFPGEWKKHHQGGPTGYETRDYLATMGEKRIWVENQAVAWNPSITGTKSEDTLLVTSKGLELLTPTPHWPMVKMEYGGKKYSRPDILVRK